MNRSRVTGDLASHGNIFVDIANDRVGIGTTIPTDKLDLKGDLKLEDAWGYGNHIKFHHSNNTLNLPSASLSNIARLPKLSFGDRTTTATLGVGDFLMYHDYYNMHMMYYGANGNLVFSNKNTAIYINGANGSGNTQSSIRIDAGATAGVKLYQANTLRFETVGYGVTVHGTTETQELNVTGVTTTAGGINLTGGNITLGDSGGDSDDKIVFGAGGDLKIFHNGSNNYIDVAGVGNLYIRPKTNFYIQDYTNGEVFIDGTLNGAVQLYHNNVARLGTTATGVSVVGTLACTSHFQVNDNVQIQLGNSSNNDFVLVHDGTDNIINCGNNGNLFLRSASTHIQSLLAEDILVAEADGAVELYHNGTKKLETKSSGINVLGHVHATSTGSQIASGDTSTNDYLLFYHDGSNGFIQNGSGGLTIKDVSGGNIEIQATSGETSIFCGHNGAVELYHDNFKCFNTNGNGITLTAPEGGDCVIDMNADEGDDNPDKWRINISQGGSFQLKNYADGSWENHIQTTVNSAVELYHDGTKKLETTSSGVTVTGDIDVTGHVDLTDSGRIKFGSDDDLQLYHNGSNAALNITTGSLFFQRSGSAKILFDSNGDLGFYDNRKAYFGDGADLKIFHDGTDSFIHGTTGTRQLKIRGQEVRVVNEANSEIMAKFIENGAVELYHDNTKKFETTSAGVSVTGSVTSSSHIISGGMVDIPDDNQLRLGNSQDMLIGHSSSGSSFIRNDTGELYLRSNGMRFVTQGNDETYIKCVDDGAVELYHNNNKYFETATNGGIFRGTTWTAVDNCKIAFGNGDDLQIWHDGTNSYLTNDTGNLFIMGGGGTAYLQAVDNENGVKVYPNAQVELYHNGSNRLGTTAEGVEIFGVNGSNPTVAIQHSNVDTEGEVIRIKRMVSPTIRHHSIKARHSGSQNNNHIAFHIHDPSSSTTAQTEALKILGSGNLTYSQQAMTILVNATDETTINSNDNNDPIHYDTTYVNKGGMSVSHSGSRITVPLNGTYLVTGSVAGSVTSESQGDGIQFAVLKNGSYQFMSSNDGAWPIESFGTENGMEYNFSLSIPVVASSNDYFELTFLNIGAAVGNVTRGYFSVTKLH